jgi:hypothetical protein
VALTADVGDDLEAIGQTNLCDLPQCGVWFLWRCGVDPSADAAPLRAGLERWTLALNGLSGSTLANQLVNGGHVSKSSLSILFVEFHG